MYSSVYKAFDMTWLMDGGMVLVVAVWMHFGMYVFLYMRVRARACACKCVGILTTLRRQYVGDNSPSPIRRRQLFVTNTSATILRHQYVGDNSPSPIRRRQFSVINTSATILRHRYVGDNSPSDNSTPEKFSLIIIKRTRTFYPIFVPK